MTVRTTRALALLAALALATPNAKSEVVVDNFGEAGWNSTDTRVNGGNAVTQPDIDSRIQFANPGPVGSDGALKLITPTGSDKATFAHVDTSGPGQITLSFTASYRWYKESPVGAPAPALKLGLNTSDPNPPSMRVGENNWDKILIYEPYDNPDSATTPVGTWVTQTIDANNGGFWMFDRNTGTAVNPPNMSLTLNQWLNDPTYGARIQAAQVVDFALGMGSGNADSIGYVDWVESSLLTGISADGRVNFVAAAVPEASSLAFLALSGVAAVPAYVVRRRRAKA